MDPSFEPLRDMTSAMTPGEIEAESGMPHAAVFGPVLASCSLLREQAE